MPRKLTPVVCCLVRTTYCTEYGQETGYHRIGSVHAVIRQAGTNWAGPVRIQIYYGDTVNSLICQRYRWKSGNAIFAWRVTWNTADGPFKIVTIGSALSWRSWTLSISASCLMTWLAGMYTTTSVFWSYSVLSTNSRT